MSALWPNGATSQPRISSGFGPRPPINGSRPFHFGVDIPLPLGTQLAAAQDGEVIFSGTNGSLGVQSVIQAAAGQFLYSHMQAGSAPPRGTRVRQGQSVGRIGMTGNTTGPHVCFRTFAGSWQRDADARDPVAFMAALNTGAAGGGGTPIEEEDMSASALIRETNGTIWLVPDDGTMTALGSMDEVRALIATGAVRRVNAAAESTESQHIITPGDDFIVNLRKGIAARKAAG